VAYSGSNRGGTEGQARTITFSIVDTPNLAPTVSITAPAANVQFTQGDNISITANAADADGTITKVEFFNGNTLLGTDTTSPYSFAWTNLPVGSFALTAKATDDKGTATVSTIVAINVVAKANVAPTVSITAPAVNAQFTQGDNISITANAADADGTITKVEFFNGNTLLGTDTTSPYSFAWTNLPVGSFSLTAKATDDKGTVTISTAVTINVVEKPNVAPTVSITAPAANAQFTQGDNISITANAADADGTIIKVEFFNGSTLLGTDTTSPYSIAWTNLPVGSFKLTTKATDDKGTATVSTNVAINVVAKANVAPTVSITAPAANAQFTQGDNISITANAVDADGTITKVEFFNGSTLLGTDTTSPYSIAWTNLPVGSFKLTTKATDDKGTATVSTNVAINVVEKVNVAPAESFTLINADSNQDMFDLTDGMQIGGSIVSGLNLNVRFNTSPSVVGSVYFTLAGPINRTRLENAAPYALFGDNGGAYFGLALPVGTYTLTARTYSGSRRRGSEGPIQAITFSIIDPAVRMDGNQASDKVGTTSSSEVQTKISNYNEAELAESEITVYPNPVRDDRVTVKDNLFNSGKVMYMLYSIHGALIQEGTVEIGDYKTIKLDFSQSTTHAAMYILVIDNENYIVPKRVNLIFD
jgi:hypothetical protein